MTARQFDVFMSLAGPDRAAVRQLVDALTKAGLSVFIDERAIREYHGITAEIESALHGSKALLAYYSRHFTSRTACQYELTAAFLAGQREGDPTRRIMVINPHEETDHLLPVELAEDKFDRLPAPHDAATMSLVTARIVARVAATSGRIGGVPFAERPRWFVRRVPGAFEFVGRYRELWILHSALHRHRFGLTQYASTGPVAVLTGLPGIGKSALAAAYAWHFGAAHLGGVYWVALTGSGTDPAEVAARFADAIRAILELTGTDVAGATMEQVLGLFAERVAERSEPSLLVIDDVPGQLDAAVVDRLVVPAGVRLHTVLISNQVAVGGPAQPVEIGPMALDDAVEMLRQYREGSGVEVEVLARRLGCHPAALGLAGRQLRDQEGLLSYEELADRIERDGSALSSITALLRDRITGLDDPSRRALQLSIVCSAAALPVEMLDRVLGRESARAAVAGLRDQLIATRLETAWQVHMLVRDAGREFLPAPDWSALAREAAAAVLDLTELGATGLALLMLHCGHLSGDTSLPDDLVVSLLRRTVAYYDERGEAILALRYHLRLADRQPDDAAVLVAAGRCLQLTGASADAHGYAVRALASATDATLRRRCLQLIAETLDALGQLDAADSVWGEATAGASGLDGPSVETELAFLRALRLRGQHIEARQRLTGMITRIGDVLPLFHEAQFAEIELARAEMETDSQLAARKRALKVMSAYHDRGLDQHVNAIEAQRLFADARLALSLWELKTDPTVWQDAADELRQLHDSFARSHGPRNMLTLNVAVAYAEALIALGSPGTARRAVEEIRDDMQVRFGERHPLTLRVRVVLGYAAAQCGRNKDALEHFQVAYNGQRELLGPTHPHTLRSQFNLAVALKLTGDSAAARAMFNEVRRAAPGSVGRGTDLFGQAFVASLLSPMPSFVWRLLASAPKPLEDC